MKYFVAIRFSIVIVLSIAALPNLTLGFEVYGAHQLSVAGDSNATERERLKCLDEARAVDDEAHYKKFMSCANDSDLQDEFGFDGPQPEKIFYAPRSEDKYAIQIDVDLGLQKMVVRSPDRDQVVNIHSGRMNYETETKAKVTPEKYCFQADSAEPLHKAKHFHNALMPHSIFFSNGVAIHELADGTLGPYSHGCLHVAAADGKMIYDLVTHYGLKNTVICLRGKSPTCGDDPLECHPGDAKKKAKIPDPVERTKSPEPD